MNKKTVRDIDVKGKKVLVRCDFNVPLDENKNITDNRRIVAALPTIKYLIEQGCKIVLSSHLGRPKGEFKKEFSLAPVAKEVIGVEIIEEAVEAAKENAARNGLENCRFIAGDVFKVLDDIEEKPDVIVLDPPRDGIHPKALPKILDYGVDTIVYISCKVTSLARDLAMFQARGYEVVKAVAVDQFCETVHVETAILLSRKAPDAEIKVRLDMSELDITNAESKATYKEIQEYVKNKYDLHVTNLYIAQVKREFGIIERENYNTGEGKAKVPQVTPEKREAIIDALK